MKTVHLWRNLDGSGYWYIETDGQEGVRLFFETYAGARQTAMHEAVLLGCRISYHAEI
ncbi:hypothetical protein M3P36_08700 [Altererythrobacter sp. KTW20L]|uniref:hypothetical protein n=1 Tax=Altererythrobacter sp. KTW20L TaxID=2942210 RepID=UPI0020BF5702|nr:hypothetical protein [Altererythrobacter sp. KTW20L]MCL6251119.1 hypothetical protein [Altererythrobacter sp. KTW20L]